MVFRKAKSSEQLSGHQHVHIFSKLRHSVKECIMEMEQLQVAIVLSEAGDLDGARATLAKGSEKA